MERVVPMGEESKEHSDNNLLMAEIKKSLKAKEKNTKCEEYAIKKFKENRKKNQDVDIFNLDF